MCAVETMIVKNNHVHKFDTLVEKKVLLHHYRYESGQVEKVATTGADVLKQRKCQCGKTETYDLVRMA